MIIDFFNYSVFPLLACIHLHSQLLQKGWQKSTISCLYKQLYVAYKSSDTYDC